ncbi:MAG: type I restriction enzyme HsdR N-terminal domain-containing protein [Bacteroidetes bacterium]|nr:type I restriction enzyme HsdR N-terminal domain-containing protein [Bacteroidota bacterium]
MKLNFPENYAFRIEQQEGNQLRIWDRIRKKWVVLTPEEWVRQHVICYLIQNNWPASRLSVERQLEVNGLKKRFDVLVFNQQGNPELLVECKAPEIELSEETMLQIATYNTRINANFLLVTNGLTHYFYAWNGRHFQLNKQGLP